MRHARLTLAPRVSGTDSAVQQTALMHENDAAYGANRLGNPVGRKTISGRSWRMHAVTNAAKEKLQQGELAIGMGVRAVRGVEIARLMKTAGFDWLFIDL